MKKQILLFMIAFFSGLMLHAQISGVYTIPGPVYPTIESAVTDLNAAGVGEGGVTFNISAGYTETFSNAYAGFITTTTSSESKPIVFQKYGTGPSPLIIAGLGGEGSYDAIIALGGTDYVTFDGINFTENPGNTDNDMQMEYAIWLSRGSSTNGTQHTTIRNCKIYGMQRLYSIASNERNLNGQIVAATSHAGTNSYNKIYADTLVNTTGTVMARSLLFLSPSSAAANGFFDEGNEIGVEGGNVFLNNNVASFSQQRLLKVANNLFTSNDGILVKASQAINAINSSRSMIYNNVIRDFAVERNSFTGINESSRDSVSIFGNTITNINFTTATTGSFNGISYGVATGDGVGISIYNNTISNIVFGGAGTTSGTFRGIFVGTGSEVAGAFTRIYGNTISGNTITSSSTTAENSFISSTYTGWELNIYNNSITGNTNNCNGITNGILAIGAHTGLLDKRIFGNTISNQSNTNGTFYGIRHALALKTAIRNNRISEISSSGASNPVIHGIFIESASTQAVYIYNNYVYNLKTPASTGNLQVSGINIAAGQVVDVAYNTIYLDASSTAVNFGTAGIYGNTGSVLKLRNNNVVNLSVASGTGRTSAFRLSSSSMTNFDPASNNNNYYAGTPGPGNLIFYDGTNAKETLLDYQTMAYPSENASISENPPFTDVSGLNYNLHIDASVSTACEGSGVVMAVPYSVVSDFFGTPRFPNPGYPVSSLFQPTAPDIGAEEIAGFHKDRSAPVVAIDPLPNTPLTSARNLTATIKDITGVPTAGPGLPVVYWKINSGTWNTTTGVFITGDQYSFTFGDGVAIGDSVSYFIVSQDICPAPGPFVGSTPVGAGGCTANPPACTTAPPGVFSYKILPAMCGNYTIGNGGDYATLTAAVNDLNIKSISCPVTLLLTDTLYVSETFPIRINAISGLSSVNTLTIRPASGVTTAIRGSNSESLITLYGSSFVTIDGSNSSGSDRSLLLYNSNSTTGASVILIGNSGRFGTSSSNIVIKNCQIKGKSHLTNLTYGIRTQTATGGGGYHDIVIHNNDINSLNTGVRIMGTIAYPAFDCQVTGNIIGSAVSDSNSIQNNGIYVVYADNTLVEGNEVIGPSINGNTLNSQIGIRVYTLATNTKVRKNKVHGFFNSNTVYGAFGIWFGGEANTVTEISNNIIYDIKGKGAISFNSDLGAVFFYKGGNIKFWNNTVDLSGSCLSSVATRSGCVMVANAVSDLDIRNNILKNSLWPATGSPASKTFAIYCQGNTKGITGLDYNNYFINGIGVAIGWAGNTTYTTLAEWQTLTGMEAHTLNVDPMFPSASNLHTAVPALNNAGFPIPGLTTDLEGTVRSNPPDPGAYEFVLPVDGINTLDPDDVVANGALLKGEVSTSGEILAMSFEYGLSESYGQTIPGLPGTVRSLAFEPVTASLSGLIPNTTYHYRIKGVSTTSSEIVYGANKSFTTSFIPENVTIGNLTIGDGTDTCFNATKTITTGGGGQTFLVQSGGNVTLIAGEKILMLPGTTVLSGGYLHGYIAIGHQYCGTQPQAFIAAGTEDQKSDTSETGKTEVLLYPNPTTGDFIIRTIDTSIGSMVSIEIYNNFGKRVHLPANPESVQFRFSLDGQPSGVYYIRVVSGFKAETLKLIKL